jgi:RPA family protein
VSGSDDGPGRREVAHRLFAAEFEDVTVSYRESDEERAPNYVVLPTGARVNRAFAVGVLTAVEPVNEEVVRARVADPTGAFVSYAGQYQPEALAFFERATPPTVVSLTGKARTFEPEDGDRVFSSLRPESVNEVDADTRDRWIVDAARATLRRVAVTADALSRAARGDDLRAELAAEGVPESLAAGVPLAIERYGVTETYLEDVRRMAVEALEVVAGERDAVTALSTRPDEGGSTGVGPVPAVVAFERPDDATTGTVPSESAAETTGVETDAETVEAASEAVEETATASDVEASGESDASPESDPGPGVAAEVGSDAPSESTAEAGQEPEPATEPPSDPEPADDGTTTDAGAASETGPEPATEPEAVTGSEPEPEATVDDGPEDFDGGEFDDDLYEMDETERAEAEEFGTEFETGSEVDPAGEAGIDVPDEPPEPEPEPTREADDGTDDADVDLEDAAVAAMQALDDGDGADREAVVARVVEAHGAGPEAVGEAIQDALMSGRCYEPDEATLKPI